MKIIIKSLHINKGLDKDRLLYVHGIRPDTHCCIRDEESEVKEAP